MKEIKGRLLSIVLAICMVFGMLPVTGITASAEETTPVKVFMINLAGGNRKLTKTEFECLYTLANEGTDIKLEGGTFKTTSDTSLFDVVDEERNGSSYAQLAEDVTSSYNIKHTISDANRTLIKERNGSDLLAGYDKVYIVFPNSGITWNDDNTITQTVNTSRMKDVSFEIADVYVNGTSMNAKEKELAEAKEAITDGKSSFSFDPSAYIVENGAVEGTAKYTIELKRTYTITVNRRTRNVTTSIFTPERELNFEKLANPSNVNLDGKTVSWSPVSGATAYEVVLEKQASDTEIVATRTVTSPSSYCSFAEDIKDGEVYVVRVTAIDGNYKKISSDATYWYPSLNIQLPLEGCSSDDLRDEDRIGILCLLLAGELIGKSEGDVAYYYSKNEPDKLLFSLNDTEMIVGEGVTIDDKVMYVYPEKDRKGARYRDITLSFTDKSVAIAQSVKVTGGDAVVDGKVVSEATEGIRIDLVVGDVPEGKTFQGWKVVSGNVEIATDAETGTSSFVMGKDVVEIVAEYADEAVNSEKPLVSKTPVVSGGIIVSEPPMVSEEPTVSEPPMVSEEPTVSEPPMVSEIPTVSEIPIVSESPMVSIVPTVSESPAVSGIPTHSHSTTLVSAKEPNCKEEGNKAYYTCSCGKFFEDAAATVEIIDKNSVVLQKGDHKKVTNVTVATFSEDGKVEEKCSICGEQISETVIPKVEKVKLAKTSYEYDENTKNPNVVVKDSKGNTLVKDTDYNVKYADDRKRVGKYEVEITLQGNYTGTKILYFTVNPKGTCLSSVKAEKKKITVKWKKMTSQTTGYQVQYGTNKEFKSSKTKIITKNKTVSATISKITAKKKYYVRIRTYKTVNVNGTSIKLYSCWSKVKSVKVK